ncbi:MAG TPA: hypothetical protein ENH60_10830 [Pricia sp.]|nr:hypothetical protein [Pricia sp.]
MEVEEMTKDFCDRCGKEIKGTQWGSSTVILESQDNDEPLNKQFCDPCTDKVRTFLGAKGKK